MKSLESGWGALRRLRVYLGVILTTGASGRAYLSNPSFSGSQAVDEYRGLYSAFPRHDDYGTPAMMPGLVLQVRKGRSGETFAMHGPTLFVARLYRRAGEAYAEPGSQLYKFLVGRTF